MRRYLFVHMLFLLVPVVACQLLGEPAAISPAPVAIAEATVSPDSEMANDELTGAAAATLPPTITVLPIAPSSPTPEPTTTRPAEPAATPTATPILLLSAEDFGDSYNRLTGELVADPAVLQRRPIAVKISNSPPSYTRPQSGLSEADLVFEHVTEGPITRFTAIIYSKMPPNIGPIRSARLIDLELPAMYDAALAYSGSSIGVARRLFSSDFASRILRSTGAGYYRTGEEKPIEHTLYGRPELFWETLEENGLNVAPNFSTQMAFSSETPAGGEAASEVTVDYREWTLVTWRYDPESRRYLRWADGEAAIDANNDSRISAANVILLFAPHPQDYNICEYQTETTCQAYATESQIWGQGSAIIVRDGQQYHVTWKRLARPDMFTFYDGAGNVVPLQIGNSWFQVIPNHYTDAVSITP